MMSPTTIGSKAIIPPDLKFETRSFHICHLPINKCDLEILIHMDFLFTGFEDFLGITKDFFNFT